MVINRNIVIKREGDKFLLPTSKRTKIQAPANIPARTFIMCRITGYDPNTGKLELKILPDKVNDLGFKIAIEENTKLLSSLNIKSIVFNGTPMRHSVPVKPLANKEELERAAIKFQEILRKRQSEESRIREEKEKVAKTGEFLVKLPVKDLIFLDGKVSFEHYLYPILGKKRFELDNDFIKKEHDSIKNYFPKALGVSKFSFSVQYEYLGRNIVSYTATCPEISEINNSIFEIVEDLYIQDNIINRQDDAIYSIDELATESSHKFGTSDIKDAKSLLSKLISKGKTKHYYHLRYLSEKHLSDRFTLKLTGKPLSFIFMLSVTNTYYLIWETYSTQEATYVWRLKSLADKHLKKDVHELIERIKLLRQNNKMAYRRERPENFMIIEHDYSGEDLGFKKWRNQLEEFMT